MSGKPEFHKISLKALENTEGIRGTDVEVFLDGEPLNYVQEVHTHSTVNGLNRVTLTVIASVEVDISGEMFADFEGKKYKLIEVEVDENTE